jgi:L-threonylcarbamoyladenylate synthase
VPDYNNQICQVLKNAGIVALPTDTVYGLAIDPRSHMALQKLYRLKRRDAAKPLVYMLASPEQLSELICPVSAEVQGLLDKYWPGALTVIFRDRNGKGKIGIRIPANQFLLNLLKEWGKPLAVTSANLSGEKELQSIEEIEKKFGDKIDVYIRNEEKFSGVASTVIDVSEGCVKVVRQGDIRI